MAIEEVDLLKVSGYFEELEEHNIIFMFKGDFNQDLINAVVVLVEGIPHMTDENILVRSRLSGAIIECMQNVCRHGGNLNDADNLRPGIILINRTEKEYHVSIGNIVETKKVERLEEHLKRIKGMDRKELKYFQREVLMKSELYGKHGADLGLINMARKSHEGLGFLYKKINEMHSFISMNVKVKRSQ